MTLFTICTLAITPTESLALGDGKQELDVVLNCSTVRESAVGLGTRRQTFHTVLPPGKELGSKRTALSMSGCTTPAAEQVQCCYENEHVKGRQPKYSTS